MTRKIERELQRQFPDAEVTTTHGNHYRVCWPDGRVVIVSNSPGDQNFMRIAIGDARRQQRKSDTRNGRSNP